MNTRESNTKSQDIIAKVVETIINTTDKIGLTAKHPSQTEIQQIVTTLNKPLRKCMHASVYLVLAILLMYTLNIAHISVKNSTSFTVLFCFLYACSDELHQLFIPGRTGQFTDVLIDTLGCLLGIFIYLSWISKFKKSKKVSKIAKNK